MVKYYFYTKDSSKPITLTSSDEIYSKNMKTICGLIKKPSIGIFETETDILIIKMANVNGIQIVKSSNAKPLEEESVESLDLGLDDDIILMEDEDANVISEDITEPSDDLDIEIKNIIDNNTDENDDSFNFDKVSEDTDVQSLFDDSTVSIYNDDNDDDFTSEPIDNLDTENSNEPNNNEEKIVYKKQIYKNDKKPIIKPIIKPRVAVANQPNFKGPSLNISDSNVEDPLSINEKNVPFLKYDGD